jgi:hypothetical protein
LTQVFARLGFQAEEKPDRAKNAIGEAERAGFDLSLIEQNLRLNPEQRVRQHDKALALAVEFDRIRRVIHRCITK